MGNPDTPPNPYWSFAYALPTDPYCLKVITTENNVPFQVGMVRTITGLVRVVFADANPLVIEYTGRVSDIELWDAQAVTLLQDSFKAELALPITGQLNKEQASYQVVLRDWLESTRNDGQEGTPRIIPSNRTLVDVRLRARGSFGWRGWRSSGL